MALEQPGNVDVLRGWIDKWMPLAIAAIEAYAAQLADVPDTAERAIATLTELHRGTGC